MRSTLKSLRHNIIVNNKLTRYALYVIGEVLLIVIGIGIAFSANNYSERSKAKQESTLFLNDVLQDLASDTIQLNKMLKVLDDKLKVEAWLIDKESFTDEDLDSIKMSVSPVKWSFNINDRSFQNIQNSSGNKLVGYENLYSLISKYYIITKIRIEQNNQLEINKTSQNDDFYNTVLENLIIDTNAYQDYTIGAKIKSDRKNTESEQNITNVVNSLSSIKTQNILKDKYARHNYLNLSLFICNIEAKSLYKTIEKSIKLKN